MPLLGIDSGYLFGFRRYLPDSPHLSIPQLNSIIADASTSAKSQSIFSLFAHYAKPGMKAEALGEIFTEKSWIDKADFSEVMILGGQVPVPWPDDEGQGLLVIQLYAGQDQAWRIYLCFADVEIDSDGDNEISPREFREFLSNKKDGRIGAFALCYPSKTRPSTMGRTESFTTWRIACSPGGTIP